MDDNRSWFSRNCDGIAVQVVGTVVGGVVLAILGRATAAFLDYELSYKEVWGIPIPTDVPFITTFSAIWCGIAFIVIKTTTNPSPASGNRRATSTTGPTTAPAERIPSCASSSLQPTLGDDAKRLLTLSIDSNYRIFKVEVFDTPPHLLAGKTKLLDKNDPQIAGRWFAALAELLNNRLAQGHAPNAFELTPAGIALAHELQPPSSQQAELSKEERDILALAHHYSNNVVSRIPYYDLTRGPRYWVQAGGIRLADASSPQRTDSYYDASRTLLDKAHLEVVDQTTMRLSALAIAIAETLPRPIRQDFFWVNDLASLDVTRSTSTP